MNRSIVTTCLAVVVLSGCVSVDSQRTQTEGLVFQPAAGVYAGVQTVAISSRSTGQETIYYTTDGSDPLPTTATVYEGPITVAASMTIRACIQADGKPTSSIASATYVLYRATDYVFEIEWGSNLDDDDQFRQPSGIAVDSSGNIYVVDAGNHRVQKFDSERKFITKWGGTRGSGDGHFMSPSGIAVDSSGNVYVVDRGNYRVQKFDSEGRFITKWGTRGSDDGQFTNPSGIAVDSSGNVFVVDRADCRVQKFDSDGRFITRWGTRGSDDGQFTDPTGIAVDSSGHVLVSDTENHRIQKFTPDGVLVETTSGYWTSMPKDVKHGPFDIATDPSGYLYTASLNQDGSDIHIGKFTSAGVLVQSWRAARAGSPFAHIGGIAVGPSGSVYVIDAALRNVEEYDPSGSLIAAWGANLGSDGRFWHPSGIAVDRSGHVYVSDRNNHRIQKFDPDGAFLGKLELVTPTSVAVDPLGNVYAAGEWSDRVEKFDSEGNPITKWGSLGSGDGQFRDPFGVAVDSFGYVYVIDSRNYRVQKFDSEGDFLRKWGRQGSEDGEFQGLSGLAVDSHGNVYVVDSGNHRVQKFDSDGKFIMKWVTAGVDGRQFISPSGIAVDSFDDVYVIADSSVQKFSSTGALIAKSTTSHNYQCSGVAVGPSGNLYLIDSENLRVLRLAPVPPLIVGISRLLRSP